MIALAGENLAAINRRSITQVRESATHTDISKAMIEKGLDPETWEKGKAFHCRSLSHAFEFFEILYFQTQQRVMECAKKHFLSFIDCSCLLVRKREKTKKNVERAR